MAVSKERAASTFTAAFSSACTPNPHPDATDGVGAIGKVLFARRPEDAAYCVMVQLLVAGFVREMQVIAEANIGQSWPCLLRCFDAEDAAMHYVVYN